ncbi:hypothetical protein BKA70DRAFT_1293715 [Coprinopsis sp. MPI-PUGE-AT-0042]|nr:hypothetical protein BKA70DRAFT_1293715 [Coprinopsis sp. MPI-PUGE-AT-0042]
MGRFRSTWNSSIVCVMFPLFIPAKMLPWLALITMVVASWGTCPLLLSEAWYSRPVEMLEVAIPSVSETSGSDGGLICASRGAQVLIGNEFEARCGAVGTNPSSRASSHF